jgi:hypothetical protein
MTPDESHRKSGTQVVWKLGCPYAFPVIVSHWHVRWQARSVSLNTTFHIEGLASHCYGMCLGWQDAVRWCNGTNMLGVSLEA